MIYGRTALLNAVTNANTSQGSSYTQVWSDGSGFQTNYGFTVWPKSSQYHQSNNTTSYLYEPTYSSSSNTHWMRIHDQFSSVEVTIRSKAFPGNVNNSNGNPPGVGTVVRIKVPTGKYIVLQCTNVIPFSSSSNNNNSAFYTFSYVSASSDPICLTDTCDILTPNGYVNVKDLSVGDLVTTPEGRDVKITKVMKPTTHVAMGKALPHFIPKNSLGENKPTKDTFISKNHAYKSGDEWLCGQFNIEHNAINWDQEFVTYYNIMTEDYPKHSLVVNGVEMECWGGYEHNKPETHGNIKLRREKLGFK